MDNQKSMEVFSKAPVPQAVFKNALPAMAAMLMVIVYNLADTFFIGQTHDALQVAAVSLATPVFLMFMAVGTAFGIGVPAALGSMLMSVSQIIINSQMAEYSDMAIAGMGVAMKVVTITGMVCMGLGQGVQPLLGYCVGAKTLINVFYHLSV